MDRSHDINLARSKRSKIADDIQSNSVLDHSEIDNQSQNGETIVCEQLLKTFSQIIYDLHEFQKVNGNSAKKVTKNKSEDVKLDKMRTRSRNEPSVRLHQETRLKTNEVSQKQTKDHVPNNLNKNETIRKNQMDEIPGMTNEQVQEILALDLPHDPRKFLRDSSSTANGRIHLLISKYIFRENNNHQEWILNDEMKKKLGYYAEPGDEKSAPPSTPQKPPSSNQISPQKVQNENVGQQRTLRSQSDTAKAEPPKSSGVKNYKEQVMPQKQQNYTQNTNQQYLNMNFGKNPNMIQAQTTMSNLSQANSNIKYQNPLMGSAITSHTNLQQINKQGTSMLPQLASIMNLDSMGQKPELKPLNQLSQSLSVQELRNLQNSAIPNNFQMPGYSQIGQNGLPHMQRQAQAPMSIPNINDFTRSIQGGNMIYTNNMGQQNHMGVNQNGAYLASYMINQNQINGRQSPPVDMSAVRLNMMPGQGGHPQLPHLGQMPGQGQNMQTNQLMPKQVQGQYPRHFPK